VHVPVPTKLTVTLSPPTVQMLGVLDVTEVTPSLLVTTLAVKAPPKTGLDGMFEIVGGVGVASPTAKLTGLPAAAA